MLNKKMLGTVLSIATIGSVAAGGLGAHAAQVDSKDTGVTINFTGQDQVDPSGDLSIVQMPAAYDFGTHPVSSTDQTYNADAQGTRYTVVRDVRATKTYKLTGALSLEDSSSNTLNASLEYDAGVATINDSTTAADAPGNAVANSDAALTVHSSSQSLTAGAGAVSLLTSNAGNTEVAGLSVSNVKLRVAGNAAQDGETYSGNITWSLDDTI